MTCYTLCWTAPPLWRNFYCNLSAESITEQSHILFGLLSVDSQNVRENLMRIRSKITSLGSHCSLASQTNKLVLGFCFYFQNKINFIGITLSPLFLFVFVLNKQCLLLCSLFSCRQLLCGRLRSLLHPGHQGEKHGGGQQHELYDQERSASLSIAAECWKGNQN